MAPPFGLGIVLASGLLQPPAPLQPAAAEPLVWHAPAACPDAAAMQRTVERFLGRPLADETVRAHGVITARDVEPGRPPELELRLVVTSPDAAPLERVLVDRDCSVLADAAALSIAIAIDPEAALREPDELPEREPPPVVAPPIVAPPVVVPNVVTPPPLRTPPDDGVRRCDPRPGRMTPRRIPCVALGADVGLQVATLPRVGPTIGGRVSVLFPRFAIGLGVQHLFSQPARVQDDPPKGGDIALTHAMLGACARLGVRTAEFPLCADLEAGAFTGRGFGVTTNATARVPWVAARLGAAAMIAPVPRLALGLRVDAAIPLVRYRFAIDGLGTETVHQPGRVGLRAAVVIETRLGVGRR